MCKQSYFGIFFHKKAASSEAMPAVNSASKRKSNFISKSVCDDITTSGVSKWDPRAFLQATLRASLCLTMNLSSFPTVYGSLSWYFFVHGIMGSAMISEKNGMTFCLRMTVISCSYTIFYLSFFLLSTGVTILLSLTVFLNTVSETMPVTSDNPLLGKEPRKEDGKAFLFGNISCSVSKTQQPIWMSIFCFPMCAKGKCIAQEVYETSRSYNH